MTSQDHATSGVNVTRTNGKIDTLLAQPGSRSVLRRNLNALRLAHGATSAVGHHASNIAELLKLPKPPARLLKVQMDGLQRALSDLQ